MTMLATTIAGMRARKLRVLITSIAVLLGVAFMAGSLIVTDTIGVTFDQLFADTNAGTDAMVRGASSVEGEFGEKNVARVNAAVLQTVRGVEGVAVAVGVNQGYAQLVGKDGDPVGNPSSGPPTFGENWIADPELNPYDLVEGRAPEAADEVAIDRASARSGKLAVGDSTTVLVKTGAETVTIVGITAFGELDNPGGASITLFTDESAQRLLSAPGSYNSVAVVAEDGLSQQTIADRIAAVLPATAEVVTGEALTAESQSDFRSSLGFFNTFMTTFAAIALFVGSFIIYNTFSIIVAHRSRETALLRAIGASRRQVLGSILFEAVIVGLIASVSGVLSGFAMARALTALLGAFGFDLPDMELVLTSKTVAVCFILGVGVSVLAAMLPARRASKVPPVEAMRAGALEAATPSRARALVGAGLTFAGAAAIGNALFGGASNAVSWVGVGVPLTFLGVAVLGPILARPVTHFLGTPLPAVKGMAGTLARNNATRNPKRTSATASALMIGVGLVGFITVFAASARASIDASIDESLGSDLVIDSGAFGLGGLPPVLRDQVAALPEVESAAAVRIGVGEVAGAAGQLVAVGPEIESMFDFDVTSGDIGTLGTSKLAVSTDRALEKGWKVGDPVTVRFGETGSQDFTVGAIFENDRYAGDVVVGLAAWEANVADQFDFQIQVLAANGVTGSQLRTAIEAVSEPYPTASVQDLSQFKESQSAEIDQLLGLIYALLGLAIVIAVLGIANTLALSIFERTRELGLLRAVGMTRAQLRSTVRWESVLIALFGTGLGLVIGIAFGASMVRALADEGFGGVVIPSTSLAVIAVLAATCGIVAAVLPARRAAKLDILRAIAAA